LPLVTYWVDKLTLKRYARAVEVGSRLMFRAGAEKVNMFTYHTKPLAKSERDVDAFAKRKWQAREFNMTAYHPLGTARIAANPTEGVCDPDHKVYGYEGLYVMDGSSVPSALGVNPQITIMTLASRAAAKLAAKLSASNNATATAI
jgi:choline dehydrogenase-like flavoprotein